MYLLRAILFFCVSQFLALTAHAQTQDGSFYLRACSAALNGPNGEALSTEDALSFFCVGYIGGFLDAHTLATTENGLQKAICAPQRGITNDQAIRIFVKYLSENPETLHESGRMSLFIALANAFPCAK